MTKEALGELILSSERQLYATAKTILLDDQDCADAIQESIVKAFSKIDTLKKDRYAKTWLMRILINECYNIARRINVNEPLDEGYAENMKQPKENRDYSELYRAVNELKEELRIRCVQLRKHSKAREKRYSFGYAVSFIFACYQILWTFPKSRYLCSRYLPLVCG